jgi:hypothetical protein
MKVFSRISFPHSPEYISSNFFENSRRYLRLKVHQQQICQRYRWQVYRRCPRCTAGKFATCVVDTGGAPWLANIREFSNFFKMSLLSLLLFKGLGGRCHEITNCLGRPASFSVSPNSNLNCIYASITTDFVKRSAVRSPKLLRAGNAALWRIF